MVSKRKKSARTFLVIALPLFVAFSTVSHKSGDASSADAELLCISPGVNLEIVEWGGKGKPMVFLAGLGHTAHVFDEFAPRFRDKYRVIGITRRGFGASSQPETGYTLDSLANDIRIVLDSMNLSEVILVGHSLGGDEITRFAASCPDRLSSIIYLDAAYDRTTTNDTLANYPIPDIEWPEPTAEELKSPEAYARFYERSNGVRMPLREIEEMYLWNTDSSFAGSKTLGSVYSQIRESLVDQVYEGITIPALAVYGLNYPIEELFMDFATADSADQVMMTARYEATKRMATLSRQRFRERMENGSVVKIHGAGHSLYITHADKTEKAMRSFLENSPLKY